MRKLSLFVIVLAVATTAAACRGSSGDDTVTPDTPGNSNDTKIQDIQNDAMPEGTAVTIKGVVVTAIDNYGAKMGDFWIEEPEGGAFSGVHVYGAPLDQVAALALGDIVDLSGASKTEFALTTDTSGNKLTELQPVSGGTMTVTKVSSGTPLNPDVVDALAIGQMSDFHARDAEWEKWEGVLIKVNNVAATKSDACVGSACSDMTLHSFSVTGDVLVESGLAAMPTQAVRSGDCLSGVTGVLDYFFNYQILPRTTAEIGTGGSSCPPPENSASLCGDGIDNDGNGFSDCNDNSCITASATCRTVVTINALQTGTLPTGGIELQNVVVAALSKPSGSGTATSKNMWVQTNLTAAANEGIYVFGNGSSLNAFTPGSRVNVIGKVTEFNDTTGTETLTEINALSITAGTGAAGTVVPLAGQTVTQLSTEPYESTLVTLTNVKVGTLGTTATFGVGDATQYPAATLFKTDDDIFLFGTANACYSTVTGVWTYLVRSDAWGFLPLAAGTAGANCQ